MFWQDIEDTEAEEEDEPTIMQAPVQIVQVMTEDGQLQEVPAQIQQVLETPTGRPRRGQQQVPCDLHLQSSGFYICS